MFSVATIVSGGHNAKRAYAPTLSYASVNARFYNRVSNTHNSVIIDIIALNDNLKLHK